MTMKTTLASFAAAFLLMVGAFGVAPQCQAEEKEKKSLVYEMRTYYAEPGKLDALHARFRDHTCKLFEKHGMTNVGYWVPVDNKENKLIYILAFPDKKARGQSWKDFLADPDWQKAFKESETDGKLVGKLDSLLLT